MHVASASPVHKEVEINNFHSHQKNIQMRPATPIKQEVRTSIGSHHIAGHMGQEVRLQGVRNVQAGGKMEVKFQGMHGPPQ